MRQIAAAIFCACLVSTNAAKLLADDWPHWRGPTRDGLTKERSNWTSGEWLSATPEWKKEIGIGASSPLIFRDHVYVVGWENDNDILRCLELNGGKEVWSQRYSCPTHGRFHKGEESLYGGPSATPEIDTETGLLYSLSIDGDLNCWDLGKKGEAVWSLNLYRNYEVKQRPKLTAVFHRDYGYTSSPLVSGDWVIVEVGSTTKGTFIAFDKKTGKEAWRSELLDEAGHTGGLVPITVEKIPCLVGLTQRHLAVIRIDAEKRGATVAKTPWVTEGDCNIATPVVVGNSVLVTSAYEQSSIARFDVDLKGMTEVWKKPFPSKVCTPVVHEGTIYYSWIKVHALDWKTGEKLWQGGAYSEAGSCIVTADGRLVVYGGLKGKVGLIESAATSPKRFKELAVREDILQASPWPHIAVGSRYVVCRDKKGNLACFSTAKPPAGEK